MRIGTERVSEAQENYLENAQAASSPRDVYFFLQRVITDVDIAEGQEDVHPQWLELYEQCRTWLDQYAPSNERRAISDFFARLSPFDQAAAALDPQALNIAFLLGAGASRPDPSNIPTVKELLPQLLERARRLDRDDVSRLADFCVHRKIDNIEDLLTAAQLATFCSRNPIVLQLLNYLLYGDGDSAERFDTASYRQRATRRQRELAADLSSVAFLQDTLQVLFGLLSSTMLPAKPNAAHEAIVDYTKKHVGATVVTTNYDCCMDLALGNVTDDYAYGVEFANVPKAEADDQEKTRLVKLHGSLNWFYCETCQEVQLIDIRKTVDAFLTDESPYPVIGVCKQCGGQRRVLLVPPLAMKFDVAPPLTPLLGMAKRAFADADLIVVVGFSFAEADVYISRMLSKSMQTSESQQLLVVDPDQRVVERIRRKFTASIPNFDAKRIVRITGDCSANLPDFLSGELSKSGGKSRISEQNGGPKRTPRKRTAGAKAQ